MKDRFNSLIRRASIDAVRREEGLSVPDRTMHLVFAGPPGTGKTTAARLLAQAYHAVGMVDKPTVLEKSGRDLVSEYVSGSAAQVQRIFDEARGGVLLVDEAYGMVTGAEDNAGKEALNQFIKLAEDRRDDTVVILAGYGEEDEGQEDVLNYLSQYNPGLKSRFPSRVEFDPYTPAELATIGANALQRHDYDLADAKAKKTFKAAAEVAGNKGQANARGVRSLVEAVVDAQADRLAQLSRRATPEELTQITAEDIEDGLSRLAV